MEIGRIVKYSPDIISIYNTKNNTIRFFFPLLLFPPPLPTKHNKQKIII